jgi:hypothetical protein
MRRHLAQRNKKKNKETPPTYAIPSTTPLSASKIKKPLQKINNFTYTKLDQIDRNP